MKKYFVITLMVFSPLLSYSQGTGPFNLSSKLDYKPLKLKSSSLNKKFVSSDSIKTTQKTIRSKKSPGLAFIYGLLVPGLGHAYANNFKTGKYFLIGEVALWLTYGAMTVYGNWLLKDAYNFAERHAGITTSGKDDDDDFYINISNYDDMIQYNNEQLLFGEWDKVYYPNTGFDFYWDEVANRKKYREDKLAADRTIKDRLFVVGAVLINHIASAISAIFSANSYNSELKSSGGFDVNADVIKYGYKVDGIKLKLTKWF